MPFSAALLRIASGVSPCAICHTISPLSRLIAEMVPYGGLINGRPCTVRPPAPPAAAAAAAPPRPPRPAAGVLVGIGESAPAFSPGPARFVASRPAVPATKSISDTVFGGRTKPIGVRQALHAYAYTMWVSGS